MDKEQRDELRRLSDAFVAAKEKYKQAPCDLAAAIERGYAEDDFKAAMGSAGKDILDALDARDAEVARLRAALKYAFGKSSVRSAYAMDMAKAAGVSLETLKDWLKEPGA